MEHTFHRTSAYVSLLPVSAFQRVILSSCRTAVSRITGGENEGGGERKAEGRGRRGTKKGA